MNKTTKREDKILLFVTMMVCGAGFLSSSYNLAQTFLGLVLIISGAVGSICLL